jgi:F-type H+-transporting ATPase subunit c
MLTPELLHYFSAGLTVALGGLGGGLGQGLAGTRTLASILRQPTGNDQSFRAMIVGLALIESGCIVALVVTLLMLIGAPKNISMAMAVAEFGAALAVGIAAVAISLASSFVVRAATQSIARQPLFAQKIFTLMLLTQSIIEAPVIFAFIVALMIKTQLGSITSLAHGMQALASGFAVAFGCIGPSIGQGIFAHAANSALGINKNAYGKIFPFTLVCEAIIETPMIFCLLFSFVIVYAKLPVGVGDSLVPVIPFFVAAFTVGVGALGGSSAIGYVASHSCLEVAQDTKNYPQLIRATLLAIAFIESTVVYALIVGFFLILRVGG